MGLLSNAFVFSVSLVAMLSGFFAIIVFDSPLLIVCVGAFVVLVNLILACKRLRFDFGSLVGISELHDQGPSDPATIFSIDQMVKQKNDEKRTHAHESETCSFEPSIHFYAVERRGPEECDLDEVFELIGKLEEPITRRLVVTHFRSGTKLVDSLSEVLLEGRPMSHAILRGVAKNTDLIPYGRLSEVISSEGFKRFTKSNYSEVLLCAPAIERFEWIRNYSISASDESAISECIATQP